MVISEVIATVDALKPNQYTGAQKVRWLSDCDSNIHKNIIQTHERVEGMPEVFYGYDAEKDMESRLIVPAPHDILYRYYLEMMIDFYNKEINAYNNSSAIYNRAYQEFAAWYNREYLPRAYADHFVY
jgi:hypothetical protein